MTDQLLPCPFCGVIPVITKHHAHEMYSFMHRCPVIGPISRDFRENKQGHIDMWNTRTQPADCAPKPVLRIAGGDVIPEAKILHGDWRALPHGTELFTHPAPAGVVLSMAQVMQAYEKVPGHLIPGSSNWCAAMATRLNACREETAKLNGMQP